MKYIALDIESIGLKPYGGCVWIISVNRGKGREVYENCFGNVVLPKDLIKLLADDSVCKVAHNAAFDVCYLLMVKGYVIKNVWCTQLAETVINAYTPPSRKRKKDGTVNYTPYQLELQEKFGTALKFSLPRYGFPMPDKDVRMNFIDRPKGLKFTKEELNYAADDVRYLLQVQKAQQYILSRDGQLETALLENKVLEKLVAQKVRGIGFDSSRWKQIAQATIKEYNKRMSRLPRVVENWNSHVQVKRYFRSIGVHLESTEAKVLEETYELTRNQVLKDLIDAKELHKAVTSYGMNFFEKGWVDPDGRIRCDVRQIIETGRMSMSNPNLQQLPKQGDFRSAFIAAPGHLLGIGDFEGQEIGIAAAMAEEKLWIDAMLRGDDVHSLTASLLLSAEWDRGYAKGCVFPKKCKCPKHMSIRDDIKTLDFGILYGLGAQSFARKTGMELRDAKFLIKKMKKVTPSIFKVLEDNGKSALRTGETFSADPYRRRRLLMSDKEWHVVNQGRNSPIQMAGANMLKLSMASMPDTIPIVLVIHDEIITENRKGVAEKAIKIQKKVMEQSADYITGIKGLIRVNPRNALNLSKK